jgi:hypothetical protein
MRYDDPNVSLSAVVGIVGAILLFVVIVSLQAVFNSAQRAELERKVVTRPSEELQQLEARQLEQLASYGWVDQSAGTVRIPVERAMDLLAGEAAQR